VTSELYSADEVASILGLHVRTVRTYVRDGRLPAVRIGKQYRIAAADVDALTAGRATTPAGVVPRTEVTAVVRVDDLDETAAGRLDALVTGATASRAGDAAPLHVQTSHDPRRRRTTVVAIGTAADTSALVGLLATLLEEGA
jgi:excisionase family DNA binding protein